MSTLTPEQRAALNTAIEGWIFEPIMGSMVERVFMAGCRYQHERTREAAAAKCEGLAGRLYDHTALEMVVHAANDEARLTGKPYESLP